MFSIEHLNRLRAAEIAKIAAHLRPKGARLLEVGAGTGRQAQELVNFGFSVEAIEILDSNYADERLFAITNYDGRDIPFPDASFDIVFSSNVLEHVPDLVKMHAEIRRVLRPGGMAVHVLPTHAWRFWTTVSAFPTALQHISTLRRQLLPPFPPSRSGARDFLRAWLKAARHVAAALYQRRHGERGNTISETWLFHPDWWRRNFDENGFVIVHDEPMGLFYTGNMTFGARWSMEKRARLAKTLGSACHIFELQVREPSALP